MVSPTERFKRRCVASRNRTTGSAGRDDDVLHELDVITGRDLEVVDTTGLVNGP
jgi:hypothetical protein